MLVPFGSYELLERIAVGGMAEVFVARSPDLGFVVLKRMHAELAQKPRGVELFLDEGQLGTLLKHPHIVETLDIGKEGAAWYLALEHVDGPDFSEVMKAETPPPARIAAYVIARAAEGLHFAHSAEDPKTGEPLRLVHRDVSPSNILVSRSGDVKISDFGVAKHTTQLHTTAAGRVIGKLAYMSPEQAMAETLDARTDVYSLSICLWEALANKRLYGELPPPVIMQQIVEATPPHLSQVVPDMDVDLADIVAKGLKSKRHERFPDAEALQLALDGWLGGEAGVAAAKEELARFISARYPSRPSLVGAAPTLATLPRK